MSTIMSSSKKPQSTVKPKATGLAQGQDAPSASLIERVQAFCNLRFPAVIHKISTESDP